MAEDISLKLTVDAVEGATSVKQLKELLKDAKDAALQFGEGSAEFAKFSQVAANAKDKIKDLNKTLDTLDPSGRGHAFQQMGGVMLGAFSAAQGAMALFGGESENLQKSLLKVQSAMALAQGFQQMQDGAKAFGAMKLMVTNVVTELGVMKSALIATGIGALAVVIGLVAANWDKVTAALFPANTQLQKNVDLAQQNYDTVHEENKLIELKTKMMKLNGDNEGTIAEWREKQYKKEADAVLLQIKAEELKLVMLKKQNDETKKSIESLGFTALALIPGGASLIQKLFGKDGEIEDTQKAIDDLKNSYIGLAGSVLDAQLQLKDFNDEQEDAKDSTDKKTESLKNSADNFTGALSDHWKIVTKTATESIDAIRKLETAVGDLDNTMAKSSAKTKKQLDTERMMRIQIAKDTVAGLENIATLFTNNNKKLANIQKAATLVQIGIDTASAISSLTKDSEGNPLNAATMGLAGVAQFASGIVRITANIAKAKQLLSSPDGGGSISSGSGGGGSASFSPIAALNQSQPQTQLGGNNNNGGSNAAPVVIQNHISETEIRAVQQRNDMYAALATVH